MAMTVRFGAFVVGTAFGIVACAVGEQPAPPPTQQFGEANPGLPVPGVDGGTPDSGSATPPADAGTKVDAASPPFDAADIPGSLLGLAAHCNVASTAKYGTYSSAAPTVDVCRLNGAFFWNAGMGIDCDGQPTNQCNRNTDPQYTSQTSFTQSDGQPLIASFTPYVVVPLPSARFDYVAQGIVPGAAALVLYNGRMHHGVFGDEGAPDTIGQASYAMAKALGINPNPATGGCAAGVTYFVFTGPNAVVAPIEDHQAAIVLGDQLALQLLQNN